MEQQKTFQEVSLTEKVGGEFTLDLTKYIGTDTKIVDIKRYQDKDGRQWLEMISDIVEPNMNLRARKTFSLIKLPDNNYGWSSESELAKFIKAKGVKHWIDLVDKSVKVQLGVKKQTKKEFLTLI